MADLRPRRSSGAIGSVSRALGRVRWAFLPLGVAALLAVGIHAAADTVCERLLWLTDRAAELFDHATASFRFTSSLAGAFSFAARTRVARGAALVWELAADVAIAIPALGYRPRTLQDRAKNPEGNLRGMLRRLALRPSTMRALRPLETAAFALAGACAVAKMVQGAVFLDLGGVDPRVAQLVALLALAAVGLVLGARAVWRALEHADQASEAETSTARRMAVGLFGSMLALPLALAALLDASPLLAFFR